MSLATATVAGIVVEPVSAHPSMEAAVLHFAAGRLPAILESSLQPSEFGRFSVLACDPIDVIDVNASDQRCVFDVLAEHMARYPRVIPDGKLPYSGGWIGFLTYEASRGLQSARTLGKPRLYSARHSLIPLARFHLYDSAAVYDHANQQWYAVAVDWPAGYALQTHPIRARLGQIKERLRSADVFPQRDDLEQYDSPDILIPTQESYASMFSAAKRYIEAGDIYQVNLSLRFTAQTNLTPSALYRNLRRVNPSTHAAFLPWGDFAILSASPELFLQLRGEHVITRPIKGTRPRGTDSATDGQNRSDLLESEKDRAELAMIVDLLRNDLGRVCRFGTVRVVEPARIEEHPTVFHRVATIEGRLDAGRNWVDLLRAAFPGGSITGAPKIRTMQIIEELEPVPRGVYCGSLGMIGLDGSLTLNLAIRTMIQTGDRVHFHAGGAIVADSTVDAEFEEIMTKSAGLVRTLTHHQSSKVCATALEQWSRGEGHGQAQLGRGADPMGPGHLQDQTTAKLTLDRATRSLESDHSTS